MSCNNLLSEAEAMQKEFIEIRRYLHSHAEVGFSLPHTVGLVYAKLREYGYTPERCGRSGITATAGKEGKTFLLRADMDALPISEETELDFSAANGNMHACGHDMHTAMLLCAAKLLKLHEAELCGTVKLMFQPAEETLSGASDMLSSGVLDSPCVDAAMMLHVLTGDAPLTGRAVIPPKGISAPSADHFEIKVTGKACHGASPQKGADALLVACHIPIALQEISTRETGINERTVLTFGKLRAGNSPNAIADRAILEGTLRTYGGETRERFKNRIREISRDTAAAFRTEAETVFRMGCPPLKNDASLTLDAERYCRELLGEGAVITAEGLGDSAGGSEDFSYIAEKVPSVMISLFAGGGGFPLHHPKVCFDESAIPVGGAVYAYTAVRWLREH